MALIQFLKDTRSELNHVAWPTRVQTIVFTILVIALSALVAAYLGFFDYIFTTGLGRVLQVLPQTPSAIESPISTSTEDIIIGTDSTNTLQVTPVPITE